MNDPIQSSFGTITKMVAIVKSEYKNGEIDGPFESYHENGQLWERGTYKDGKPEGTYTIYHSNGQLLEKNIYKNGMISDGPYESYSQWSAARTRYLQKWKRGTSTILSLKRSVYMKNIFIKME